MSATKLHKCARFAMSAITMLGVTIFGFAGVGASASAATATISNTGPDSTNEIVMSAHKSCEVTNDNDVDIDNVVNQDARSGDATVSGNTVASGWGAWDPAVWQHKGYSYAEWSAAFESYMASQRSDWAANWGNISGGGATSGDASNTSSVHFAVAIENGGCEFDEERSNPGIQTHGSSQNPHVLGAQTTQGHEGKGGGMGGIGTGEGGAHGLFGANAANVSTSGAGAAKSGSSVSGPGGSVDASFGGCLAGIDTTGPSSTNKIICSDSRQTSIGNTNNINIANAAMQQATSGDATAGYNTSAGTGGSGDAGNTGVSTFELSASN